MGQLVFVWAAAFALLLSAILAYGIDRVFVKPTDSKSRYGGIDGLRGILSFLVFSHHYVCTLNYVQFKIWSAEPLSFNVLNGPVGVTLFFMITAFLFWRKLDADEGRLKRRDFYLNRVLRIAPLYWFHLGVMITLILFIQGWQTFDHLRISDLLSWMIFCFTGRPDIGQFPLTWRLDAGASWTLAYEFLFYMTFPILALTYKLPWRYVGFSVLTAVIVIGYLFPTNVLDLPINTKYFAFFLSGFLAVYAEKWAGLRRFASSNFGSVTAVACLLLIYLNFREIENPCVWILLTGFFFLVVSGCTLFGLLKTRGVLFLGSISYSLYLLHGLVLYVAFTLIWPHALEVISERNFAIYLAGVSVVLVLISSMTYAWIERPSLKLYRRLMSR